jgi:hypothetical protein
VKQALATVIQLGDGDARLAAYVVCAEPGDLEPVELKKHLRKLLPEYMVPGHLVEIEKIPLTLNGKVDRKQLPAPDDLVGQAHDDRVPPTTVNESGLSRLWADALGVTQDRISIRANFFDLGGHSLLSIQVISRLESLTGYRLSPRVVLLNTLEQIAAILDGEGVTIPDPSAQALPQGLPTANEKGKGGWLNRLRIR